MQSLGGKCGDVGYRAKAEQDRSPICGERASMACHAMTLVQMLVWSRRGCEVPDARRCRWFDICQLIV